MLWGNALCKIVGDFQLTNSCAHTAHCFCISLERSNHIAVGSEPDVLNSQRHTSGGFGDPHRLYGRVAAQQEHGRLGALLRDVTDRSHLPRVDAYAGRDGRRQA